MIGGGLGFLVFVFGVEGVEWRCDAEDDTLETTDTVDTPVSDKTSVRLSPVFSLNA